jgi:hypothetical protein
LLVEDAFDGIGDGGFSGAGESAKPDNDAALAKEGFFIAAIEETVEFGMDVHGWERDG